jgi:molybdopterin-guanine dinucleotide biosynthesis protein A
MDVGAVTIAADHPPTLGVVLAGGAARRMGGDKALREIGGRTLLARAIETLTPQCSALVVSIHGDDAARFAAAGPTILADDVAGRAGPLAGILRAMDHAAVQGVQWLLSAPVDCPFLPGDLAARLHRARDADQRCIALAASEGRVHPVIALWPVTLRDALRQSLGRDARKVGGFVAHHPHVTALWAAQPFDPFLNVNTPEDLRTACAIAAQHGL